MVVDFREELCVQQDSKCRFSYCWIKADTATEEMVDIDYSQSCTYEEMMSAVCTHGFDPDKVHNHFLNDPCDSLTLTEEY